MSSPVPVHWLWVSKVVAGNGDPGEARAGGIAGIAFRADAGGSLSPELRTLREDLAAFQQEEMQALQSCISVLVHERPRDEASAAHALHCAARQRTRRCLLRLQAWSRPA